VITRLAVLIVVILFGVSATGQEQPIQVYFSPGFSCTEAIVRELSNAKQTVHVQAYSFTSQPIARALTDAEKRGVKVIAIFDASNRTKNYSAADFLAREGVETHIDSTHANRRPKSDSSDNVLHSHTSHIFLYNKILS
jgi:phosphatidylserine/phosphatidylglycerophosphate/cardiolipin synthase-like enzyme